jgi:hypothetical protein
MVKRPTNEDCGEDKTTKVVKIRDEYSHALDAVEKHFSGAHEGATTLECVKPVIEKLGLTDDNTLFAQSICPDEINHEEGDVPNLFSSYLGEVFHMGGLAGIPFTGKTGFAAFSHHVPDNGHCFILMAPHIGLSNDANFGQYSRDGQTGGAGSACGAAVGALGHCCAGLDMPDMTCCFEDQQMAYIIHQINARKESILEGAAASDSNTKQANLARANYEIANEMLEKIVSLDFGDDDSTLVILTGIQINMPRVFGRFFSLVFVMAVTFWAVFVACLAPFVFLPASVFLWNLSIARIDDNITTRSRSSHLFCLFFRGLLSASQL